MKPPKKGVVAFANGYNRIKATKYGYMMYNSNDIYVGGSFDKYGEFSDEEVRFVCSRIKPTDVVMDIGANYGALTIPMARCASLVYAFEPQRPAFYATCANLAINNLENVVMENMGLSNLDGLIEVPKLDFNATNNIGGLSMKETPSAPFGESRTYKVRCSTLDKYVFDNSITKLDFIKMDVEGMEESVLKGSINTIKRYRPSMYIEADREDKVESLLRYISSLGYSIEWHRPPLFNPNNFFGEKKNIWNSNLVSINVICTPI